jgi:hypothetical protein
VKNRATTDPSKKSKTKRSKTFHAVNASGGERPRQKYFEHSKTWLTFSSITSQKLDDEVTSDLALKGEIK